MRIDELDEFQGLTADLIRQHLAKTGWWLASWDFYREWLPEAYEGPPCVAIYDGSKDGLHQLDPASAIRALLVESKKSPQDLLREINPRMHKGMPSEAARKACASWLVRDVETGEVELHRTEGTSLYSASDYKSGTLKTEAVPLRDFGDWMEFWPCDANGNKLRWPIDANGAML